MLKRSQPFYIFSVFAAIFAFLYFKMLTPLTSMGLLSAAVLAVNLPKTVSFKMLFPLGMLFLFLLVLSETPERLFTASLIYVVQLLLFLRAGMMVGVQFRTDAEAPRWKLLLLGSAFTLELVMSVILLISTFKFLSAELLNQCFYLRGLPLILVSTIFTPFAWLGGVAGILYLLPMTRVYLIPVLCVLILANGVRLRAQTNA